MTPGIAPMYASEATALIRATIAEERLVTDRALNDLKSQVAEGNLGLSKQLDELSRKLAPLWAQARENERGIKALRERSTPAPPPSSARWRDRIAGSILGALIVAVIAFPGMITAAAAAATGLAGLIVKLRGTP